jgi:hypothetical protein
MTRESQDQRPPSACHTAQYTSPIKLELLQLLDQPLSAYWRVAQLPCAINEIDIVGGQVRVLCINDTSHVRALA